MFIRPCISQKKTLPISEEDPAYLRRRPCLSQKKTLHISEEDPAYLRRRPCISQKKTLHISEEYHYKYGVSSFFFIDLLYVEANIPQFSVSELQPSISLVCLQTIQHLLYSLVHRIVHFYPAIRHIHILTPHSYAIQTTLRTPVKWFQQ